MKTIISIIIILFFANIIEAGNATIRTGNPLQWKQIYLRSQAQADEGKSPGGEGYQLISGIDYGTNGTTVYAGANTCPMFVSLDGGDSWTLKVSGLPIIGIVCGGVKSDPLNSAVAFAAGGLDNEATTGDLDGIYYTTNSGNNWTLGTTTPFHRRLGQNHVFAFDDTTGSGGRCQTIYAGSHARGVLKTTNGGTSWSFVAYRNTEIKAIQCNHPTGSTTATLYVCCGTSTSTNAGLYKLTDDSVSGTASVKLSAMPFMPRCVAIIPNASPSSDTVVVTTGTEGSHVYRSTNGGTSFTAINTGLVSGSTRNYRMLAISPANSDYAYTCINLYGSLQPFYTHNLTGIATWTAASNIDVGNLSTKSTNTDSTPSSYYGVIVAPHPSNTNIAIHNAANTFVKTTDGGDTWTYSGSGYALAMLSMSWSPACWYGTSNPSRWIWASGDQGMHESMNAGSTWDGLEKSSGTSTGGNSFAIDSNNSNIIIASAQPGGDANGRIYRTTTGTSGTWALVSTIPSDSFEGAWFSKTDSTKAYIAGATDGYYSTDSGVTFTTVTNRNPVAVYDGDGDIVYAIDETVNPDVWYKSTDNMQTFATCTGFTSNTTMDCSLSSTNSNLLIATRITGINLWNGSTWSNITNDLPVDENFGTTYGYGCLIDPDDSTHFLCGLTSAGQGRPYTFIYESVNSGTNWTSKMLGLSTNGSCNDINYKSPGVFVINTSIGSYELQQAIGGSMTVRVGNGNATVR